MLQFFILTIVSGLMTSLPVGAELIHPLDLASSGAMALSSYQVGRASLNPAWAVLRQKNEMLLVANMESFFLDNTNLTPSGASLSGMKPDPYQASKAETKFYGGLGLDVVPIKWLSLSISGKMPSNKLGGISSISGEESNYLLYDRRAQRPDFATALGIGLGKKMALGLGIIHSFKAKGQIQLAASDRDADARMAMDLLPDMIPFASFAFRSEEEGNFWALGMRWRREGKAASEIEIDTSFNISGVGSFPLSTGSSLVAFYDPEMYGLGVGRVEDLWQFHLRWDLIKWSHYRSPVISLIGRDLTNLTGGQVDYDPVSLKDVNQFSIGGEYRVNEFKEAIRLIGGASYRESALADAPTSLSVLDSPSYSLSTGIGKLIHLSWPEELNFDGLMGIRYTKMKEKKYEYTNAQAIQKSAHTGGGFWEASVGGSLVF